MGAHSFTQPQGQSPVRPTALLLFPPWGDAVSLPQPAPSVTSESVPPRVPALQVVPSAAVPSHYSEHPDGATRQRRGWTPEALPQKLCLLKPIPSPARPPCSPARGVLANAQSLLLLSSSLAAQEQ